MEENEGAIIGSVALVIALLAIGVGAVAARDAGNMTDNNVSQIIAGDNITISPENGYGIVTINSTGVGDGGIGDNNVTQIVAGDNITISPENGYGIVTVTVTIDNIRPSQLYEEPAPGDDGKFPQYEESDDMFSWVSIDRGWVVLEDITLGDDATNVTFSGLNMESSGPYQLIIMDKTGDPDGWSSDHWRQLFFNGDTTNTNYYIQSLGVNDGSVTSARNNDAYIRFPYGNSYGLISILMGKIEGGYPYTFVWTQSGATPSAILRYEVWHVWNNTANVTSITFNSYETDKIKSGTRLILLGLGA